MNRRRYCITEDKLLNRDFFDVINKIGSKRMELLHLGNTQYFIIDVLSFLKRNPSIAAELSDLRDEIEANGGGDLDKALFADFNELYEPDYFYFFDTDRLHPDFFPRGHSANAVKLKEHLLTLNRIAGETMPGHFYLVPSFPSLAAFAWQISSYRATGKIKTVNKAALDSLPECKNCANIPKKPRIYSEPCVICQIRVLERKLGKIKGYSGGEKKLFCEPKPNSRKKYPYLDFLRGVHNWDGFYRAVRKSAAKSALDFFSPDELKISESLIQKLSSVSAWFSAIPIVIETSIRS